MAITFAKAPLIELIAEVRWIPQGSMLLQPGLTVQQPAMPEIFVGGVKQEEFYKRLGRELYSSGFDRSERLLPVGMPFALHQPVYRFQSEKEGKTSVLYQVGYGIFSVHAIPPYHSWAQFLPFVRSGLEALLGSRLETDRSQPFSQTSLRYIDFFDEGLLEGHNISSFIMDVLKISTKLPVPISRVATSNELKSVFTKVVVPVDIGDLTLSVGDGQFNNRSGILLDNMVSKTAETAAALDAIMTVYNSAYSVIHNIFFELTRPIHDLMEPQGESRT
jgi:uncharacterized protein (TIGR04255 family)